VSRPPKAAPSAAGPVDAGADLPAPVHHAPRPNVGKRLLASRVGPFIGVGTVLLLLLVHEAISQPQFFDAANLTNVGRSLAVPLVLAGAMTLVVLTGGVDLSIGSSLALSGTLYAKLYHSGMPPGLALVLCLMFGAVVGFVINGILIGRLDMSFFVVTLGTLSLYRGIVLLWTHANTIDMYGDPVTSAIGNETILGGKLPVGFLIGVVVIVVLFIILRFTTFGRQVYAVGGNREAARLSGVRSEWVIAAVYAVTGLAAALAALMSIGRASSVDPNMGTSLELEAAAAALLGGIALSGGVGSIWGTVLAVVFLGVLSNALALAGASTSWQLIVTGAILVVAVYLDRIRTRAQRAG